MRSRIEAEFAVLIGKPLRQMGRAGLMEWVGFGDMVTISSLLSGEEREVAEYALHLQCSWRLLGPEGIITGATDLFHAPSPPYEALENEEWNTKVGDRLFVTLCDARIDEFLSEQRRDTLPVEKITADDVGSLRIELKGGFALEVFPDDSLPGEHWRFFRSGGQDPHFVVTGLGIEGESDAGYIGIDEK